MLSSLGPFSSLKFDCRTLRQLPVDDSYDTGQRQVPNSVFSLVKPTPVVNPRLIAQSKQVARELLEVEIDPVGDAPFLAGCVPDFGQTAAHCYAGHQFGYFSGQLGDGATMYLGEVVNSNQQRWEVQFKGAGLTPFSRTADGRKVLRSSIREFLCSEHMAALGIKTTRALSICDSDSKVVRDMLYDGHPTRERCSVIVRVAESFLRFGSFEIAKITDRYTGRAGPSPGKYDLIAKLVRYTKESFYPQTATDEDFVVEVARRTGELVAQWQCVGFCHGVMNTDNMSILGLTLDYGPFGFMETYNPEFVPNLSDHEGSYRFERQPTVGLFNLKVLAKELGLAGVQFSEQKLDDAYREAFFSTFATNMFNKLGLPKQPTNELVFELLGLLRRSEADYTMFFRALGRMQSEQDFDAHLKPCLGAADGEGEVRALWKPWLASYFGLAQDQTLRANMAKINPVFVLRNHVAQRAIDEAEEGRYEELNKVLGFCLDPFTETAELVAGAYHKPSKTSKCNAVSCSS
ncbi:hypothetical protein BASA81_000027 [Batrachochytrium salamandrivorans]|nr:hypothetical protein BASA81_000027 [Batrachochytrium salamandrivorans]